MGAPPLRRVGCRDGVVGVRNSRSERRVDRLRHERAGGPAVGGGCQVRADDHVLDGVHWRGCWKGEGGDWE